MPTSYSRFFVIIHHYHDHHHHPHSHQQHFSAKAIVSASDFLFLIFFFFLSWHEKQKQLQHNLCFNVRRIVKERKNFCLFIGSHSCAPHNQEKLLQVCFRYQDIWTMFFSKKIIKICLVLFWFCPPQSGAPNFRPPGRQTQTQVRNFNAISRSPAGFVKVPFVSPPSYKPSTLWQKAKKDVGVIIYNVYF